MKRSVSINGEARIEGTVTVGGVPVRDAEIQAEGPLPVGANETPLIWRARVDAAGMFRIPVPPGTYTVRVPSSPAHVYAFGIQNVFVKFDEHVEVHLTGALKPSYRYQQKASD